MSEAPEHAQQPWPLDPEQSRRTVEEDRAWAQLYASVGQAATAEEVVKQLDADAEAKRKHLALYLRARTTLREQRAAEARNLRIGAFVRSSRRRSSPTNSRSRRSNSCCSPHRR